MFQSSVPVFDCNAALGRRHKERVSYDTPEDLLRIMSENGIERALVYNPYCAAFGSYEGNQFLLEQIQDESRLVPQFVVDFAVEDLDEVKAAVKKARVRSLRVFPNSHGYPLVHWIAGPWLEWMASENMALWIPMGYSQEIDIRDLYDTASRHPKVPVVLAGTHYSNFPEVWPLMKALDNIYMDLSRFDLPNGVERLIKHVGVERLLFGSDFPEVDPAAYLFYLHHCGLDQETLKKICYSNLERLLSERS